MKSLCSGFFKLVVDVSNTATEDLGFLIAGGRL